MYSKFAIFISKFVGILSLRIDHNMIIATITVILLSQLSTLIQLLIINQIFKSVLKENI